MSAATSASAAAAAAAQQRDLASRLPRERNVRNVELILLVLSFAIGGSALVLVQLGKTGAIDTSTLVAGGVLAVLLLAFHIMLRFTAPRADPLLLPIAATINFLGLAMIYRIDFDLPDYQQVGSRQLAYTILSLGVASAAILLLKNYRVLQRYSYIAMLVGVGFLLLPLVPGIGRSTAGARIWINIAGFNFQPAEVAKIALAVFFAGYLVTRRDSLAVVGKRILGFTFPRGRDFWPIVIIWLMSMAVLVFQRDLGTSLLYFGLFLVMIYVATGRVSWIVIGIGLFAAGAYIASRLFPYVNGRLSAWLDPFDPSLYDQQGGSYQLVQGLFGQAAGGFFGAGLGLGRPAITPLANSDYIFASLSEELGLVGIFALLCLYLVLVARGLRIGFAGQDDFGKLLATGLSFVIGLQCFIVIGGVTRLIPLTGLTAPFLAAGGSSLLANWLIVALLLRVSDSVRTGPKVVAES